MSKTDDRMILRPVSQDSPGSDSTAEPPSEKSQKQLILATQTSSLEKRKCLGKHPERPIILSPDCLSRYHFFSVNYSFSTNYFSTPPGVLQNKKTPSHFRPPLMTRDPADPSEICERPRISAM